MSEAFVVSVEGVKQVQSLLSGLFTADKILARAINKGVDKARTASWEQVGERFNMKRTLFYSKIRLKKANETLVEGAMKATNYPFSFGKTNKWEQFPVGVRVEIYRGKHITIPHKFWSLMPTQHKGVFYRVGKKQYPIKERFGFSAAQMLDDPPEAPGGLLAKVQEAASNAYVNELNRQIDLAVTGIIT